MCQYCTLGSPDLGLSQQRCDRRSNNLSTPHLGVTSVVFDEFSCFGRATPFATSDIGVLSEIVILLALSFVMSQAAGVGRTVLATVLNPRNQPIVDVEADDFVVREQGKPQEILAARVADYPVVILLDNSTAAEQDFEAMRAAAIRFIGRIGDRPVAVATVGAMPATVASFADDRTTVLERLRGLSAAAGQAQVIPGMASAAGLIRSRAPRFRRSW